MTATLAFDVYGTLIDTAGVITVLKRLVGDRAAPLSQLWREKQLEYSFRRGLMQNYRDFPTCTAQALDYACTRLGVVLDGSDRELLLAGYRVLPAFPEVKPALTDLKAAGFRLFAFSNGCADDLQSLLAHADIGDCFEDVVSCDEIGSFKPNPAVYAHFLRRAGAHGGTSWLVSSNPFDVIGAISAGMNGAWVRRTPQAVFDPWEIQPTVTVTRLTELNPAIKKGAAA
ncbi:haloacid dehalogenase type II [Geothermobacter hydrogeniphilus]|uniref:Haloacid dehalogenase, type II n=1 Tax=Geothermobacter hydrogeniphilus TaxID=1969733 RepID=A0A1X0YDY5_9BACT|nr:haloacid dehalogenase type II [Geothermobacter hydrogeniphilus]ORJ63425.1 haloacid dehalogenase, type II [Geothermobacter hydrogeniphilus]